MFLNRLLQLTHWTTPTFQISV